jgi:hypothetical protein
MNIATIKIRKIKACSGALTFLACAGTAILPAIDVSLAGMAAAAGLANPDRSLTLSPSGLLRTGDSGQGYHRIPAG